MVLIRQSVQKIEQARIDGARARLTQQIAQYSMALPLMSGPSSGSNAFNGAVAGMSALQQLLATASSEQADGRVVVHLSSLESLADSPDNVVLDDQDSISIPKRPSSINVLGQVNNPTSIVARPGWTVADYLYGAGGPTKNGDMSELMVIKSDGTVITQQSLENAPRARFFPLLPLVSGGLKEKTLSPGDTIYVPDNLQDIPGYLRMTETKDISTIIANTAMSLGVIGLLGSKL
jgi:protein involved in polysaccharide export with SLBB domain